MRQTVKQPGANVVAAGQTATFRVPVGMRIHHLFLVFAGLTLAQINEVRVKLNASNIIRVRGDRLNMMNMFAGLSDATATGVLQIPFDRVGLKQRAAEEMTALNTNVAGGDGRIITSVTVEVDIDAAAANPVLDLYGEVSPQIAGGPGSVRWLLPETVTVNSAGQQEYPVTPVGSAIRRALDAAYLFSANVTRVQVQRNQRDLFDRKSGLNDTIQADGVRMPQAGVFVFDPSERGYGGNMVDLAGVQDFRYIVDYSASGDYVAYNAFIGAVP